MKYWLCKEYNEVFMLEAETKSKAVEGAMMFGGTLIRELKPEELKQDAFGHKYTEATE